MNCDKCKYYCWYYDRCEKWDCEVDGREVHNCFEKRKTRVSDTTTCEKNDCWLKERNMKVDDFFVDVHFPYGCCIGKVVSDEGKTVTVEFDNGVVTGIPKDFVTVLVN